MSKLLEIPPFGPRNDTLFLEEINLLTQHHLNCCTAYAKIWPQWKPAVTPVEVPFLHVGVFKHVDFKTTGEGIRHERTLYSSSTTGGTPSRIALDSRSSQLQSQSANAILNNYLGAAQRPLLILDSSKSLLKQGAVSARIAAAMSLMPLASEISFLLDEAETPASINWQRLQSSLDGQGNLLIYGFTWMLWQAWTQNIPQEIATALALRRVDFVHSGGWKKLEATKIRKEQFDSTLLKTVGDGSRVIDFYGLVEQVGVIYPLCESGSRHVPAWAHVIVRNPFTLIEEVPGDIGLLQFINTLAWGAPYFSVLTEDLGRIIPGNCPCGRAGPRFELQGRVPKSEMRGCANV